MKVSLRFSCVVFAEHGRLGRGQYSAASIRAIGWLRMFIKKLGDHMPMKDEIHLPTCLTKFDVYMLAADDLSQGNLQCCGMSTFYRIWAAEFPNVKIPQVRLTPPPPLPSRVMGHVSGTCIYNFHILL